ncbi:hypothetical protein NQ318_000044 [Aromia moschata]|uniref:C2H2-type domain-containing protein n=1 Tax=Aromia moschata TaxID=1265417 RepID=A0AAV8YAH8_9CUCU|nr:hypothetical protein NQ318_000044 [Aromia moschata]
MNEMGVICRFCLKTIKKTLPIDKMIKEIIRFLMLKLMVDVYEPLFAGSAYHSGTRHVLRCAETLQMAFDFKSVCIYTEDCLSTFIEGKSEARLDLQEIYLKINDNEDIESVKEREIMGVIEKPVACQNCCNLLRQYSLFVTSFSDVEQKIQSYARINLGRDCVGEVDLRQVRDFSLSNVIKREVEAIGYDKVAKEEIMVFSKIESHENIISEEKIKCEEIGISESKIFKVSPETERREQEEFDGFSGNDEFFTSNQTPVVEESQGDVEMKCSFLELLETKVKRKYLEEDIEKIKGETEKSQRRLSPGKIDECQELEACLGIKSVEFEIKKEDNECDGPVSANASEMEVVYPEGHRVNSVEDAEGRIYPCKLCPYKAKRMNNFKEHMLIHKDFSEVTIYQCQLCPYKSKRKGDLNKHILIHKGPSEVTTYDCNICSYQGQRKSELTSHMLVHEDISKNASEMDTKDPNDVQAESVEDAEGRIHHCKLCPYKNKLKHNLTRHMLVHKDISEVKAYRCKLCPYKTKQKFHLIRHMRNHEDSIQVPTYDCSLCSYKVKHKGRLSAHMLIHDISENAPEIETSLPVKTVEDVQEKIYECNLCPYKTKLKHYFPEHMLIHKDISEVKAHRCKLCPYETKRKRDLATHMLSHMDLSEVTTYDCNFCSYKAKRKQCLTKHMMIHKDSSKVIAYHCQLCPHH